MDNHRGIGFATLKTGFTLNQSARSKMNLTRTPHTPKKEPEWPQF